MQVLYKSTRGKEETVTASMAILKGLSEDGGLFVPTEIPKLDVPMDELAKMSYQETAYEVMKCFLTDFTEEELKNCINNAYDEKFLAKQHEEYEYNGKRYVRVEANSDCGGNDFTLSNGEDYKDGDNVWIEVQPVKWIVDEKSRMMITEKLIFAGVQFNK